MLPSLLARLVLVFAAIPLVLASAGAIAEKKYGPGASDTEIKVGNTNPYSGPASAYGTIGRAEAAYFAMINDQGGVNGRKINFITLDDGYSPPKTVEQTRKLVEQDQVLLLFAPLGTPPNTAIHRYMNAKQGTAHLPRAPARPNGAIPRTSHGPSASIRTTRRKRASTLNTCSRKRRTRRWRSSTRTTISVRTTSTD